MIAVIDALEKRGLLHSVTDRAGVKELFATEKFDILLRIRPNRRQFTRRELAAASGYAKAGQGGT